MKTLLIDNYDSYTYNLYQLIADVNGELPTVVRNDEVDWHTLKQRLEAGEFHNVIISPGPGTPERTADVGVSLELLRSQLPIPVLGVCLGFQALALAHGGTVRHAPEPVHGRLSGVKHSGHPLFHGVPSGAGYAVVRYHSLLVEEATLPACLEPIAWTCGEHHALQLGSAAATAAGGAAAAGVEMGQPAQPGSSSGGSGCGGGGGAANGLADRRRPHAPVQDGGGALLMAVAHRSLPHYGVQFHPESVATGYGLALLRNFAALTWSHMGGADVALQSDSPPSLMAKLAGPPGASMPPRPWAQPQGNLRPHYQALPGLLAAAGGSEALFWHLFGGTRSSNGGGMGNGSSSSGSRAEAQRAGRCAGEPAAAAATAAAAAAADTWWLDSATVDRGRFSFMGGRGGRLWRRIEYHLPPLPPAAAGAAAGAAVAGTAAGAAAGTGAAGAAAAGGAAVGAAPCVGILSLEAADGQREEVRTDFFGWLQGLLERQCCCVRPEDAQALPFNFWGGLVGYLGYELKEECGGGRRRPPGGTANGSGGGTAVPAGACPSPDAAFFLADQLLAVDHHTDTVYALALYEVGSSSCSHQEAVQWVAQTAERIRALAAAQPAPSPGHQNGCTVGAVHSAAEQPPAAEQQTQQQQQQQPQGKPPPQQAQQQDAQQPQQQQGKPQQQQPQQPQQPDKTQQHHNTQQQLHQPHAPEPFRLREGRSQYLRNVVACMQALHDGESYEVCLTTMLSRGGAPDAAQLYRTLRRINPAPYAAWMRFGAGDLQLCCCSPERFLRGDRGGQLEAKPIKGTAPRFPADPKADARSAAELAASEKDRAENLMIVDLLRNDLGRVCHPGSVHVPRLMQIESYATVHQMVSTVRGLRRPEASIVDCLRAAFPGGSMTGAPKIRTMAIIDQLEQGPRGVYSGSLGYISFNDTFDLNIVIRTAVIADGRISIGAGGAIVVQSEPEGEYEEMRLKARALLRAIGECDGAGGMPAAVAEEDEKSRQ